MKTGFLAKLAIATAALCCCALLFGCVPQEDSSVSSSLPQAESTAQSAATSRASSRAPAPSQAPQQTPEELNPVWDGMTRIPVEPTDAQAIAKTWHHFYSDAQFAGTLLAHQFKFGEIEGNVFFGLGVYGTDNSVNYLGPYTLLGDGRIEAELSMLGIELPEPVETVHAVFSAYWANTEHTAAFFTLESFEVITPGTPDEDGHLYGFADSFGDMVGEEFLYGEAEY